MYVPHGLELQLLLHDTCFRCDIASPMFISVEFYTPEGMDYAPIMLALEEKILMYWIDEHLFHNENLILHGSLNGEVEELQLLPYQLLEDKQHFGGEDCNVPT